MRPLVRQDPLSPSECGRVRALLEFNESDQDTFGEAHRRMHDDAEFNAGVNFLAALAMKRGFTPYELKQMAFAAALKVEMHTKRTFVMGYP